MSLKLKFNVQQSPRLSCNLREGLMSLFSLDERQGDGSQCLVPSLFLLNTRWNWLVQDTGRCWLVGRDWVDMRTVSSHCAFLCLDQEGSRCFCCSSYCTSGSHIFDVHRSTRLDWSQGNGIVLLIEVQPLSFLASCFPFHLACPYLANSDWEKSGMLGWCLSVSFPWAVQMVNIHKQAG